MAFFDTTWYCNFGDGSTTGYYAVTKRPQNTAVAAGVLRRQFTAPAVGSERVFVCIVAGTTANTTDATWTTTRGAKVTDGTCTWQECTGASAVNGDLTNTVNWTAAKAAGTPTLGAIIQRNNGASYQICTTAGAMGASEPSFSDTAGVTTTDSSAVWTCIGPVGNFTGGQAPHARLANALATNWFNDGHTIYVGDNHAESQTTSISFAQTSVNNPAKILCHNHSGSYPPTSSDLTTGATISTASTSATLITLNLTGTFYFSGITFKAAVGATSGTVGINLGSTTSSCWYYFNQCSFWVSDTSATNSNITLSTANAAAVIIFNNTTVKFTRTISSLLLQLVQFSWQNTGAILESGSAIPATLLKLVGNVFTSFSAVLEALDLSQLTGSLYASNVGGIGQVTIKDCKLNASATVTTPTLAGQLVQLVRCDSSATAYKSARHAYEGTETSETTITRVGGASDPAGQTQTRKIVTTANALWLRPFQAEPYAIWNTVTGSTVTVTVYGTINSASLPLNDDIWLEAEYLGDSSFPLGEIVTTTKATLLSSNAAVASDGSSWNGGGSGAGWSPFKLTTTLSSPQPAMAGYIEARVRVGKPSATYHIDPMVELS